MATYESHDQHFKNLFLDFPQEALRWLLPQVIETWGPVQKVEFVRQEPRKRKLAAPHLALDMPILFTFRENRQVLLWLVEFQEDKTKFSIHTLAHYTIDMMAAHPTATVVPTVLFTDRVRWRKDVERQLTSTLLDRMLLHFEYVFVKLFDFHAQDYYDNSNPVVNILLPKMQYPPKERWNVIWHAYWGLYQLVSLPLFEKYMDFIDIYAEVTEDEHEHLLHELQEQKEFVMIRQVILEEGRQEGRQEGWQEGMQEGQLDLLHCLIAQKFPAMPEDMLDSLRGLRLEDLTELGKYLLFCESVDALRNWIDQRKQGYLS